MSIPGYATPEATAARARTLAGDHPNFFTNLGRTGLTVSRLGFGTYRCNPDIEQHRQALLAAIAQGCNLIDTSANYMDGGAEVLIGDVLNELVVWGDFDRELLTVVSKVGYIQGENMELVRAAEEKGRPFPETVKLQDQLWHCIHPDFLEDQITRSLARMHLDTLDVYLLHNPEYFLMSAIGEEGLPREEAERLFYDRIRRAFIHLEKLVEEGLIRYYGISSNGFPLHPDELDYVSLSKVWRAYQDACLQSGKTAEDGHFAVVQMPCNWVEHQAVTLPNNLWEGDMLSVVEMASRLRLGVLTNRPLNAIRDNRLLRFAAYSANPPANPRPHFDKHLENLETLEQTLRRYLTDHKIELDVRETPILDLFYNADRLRQLAEGGGDHSQAREILQSYFLPWIEVGSRTLADHMAEDTQLPVMLDAYQRLFLDTGQAWLDLIDAQNLVQISPFLEKLGQLSPTPAEEGSIAQKALQVCLNLPGVDVVLNGMRNSDYVAESMAVLNFPAGFDPLSLLTPSE